MNISNVDKIQEKREKYVNYYLSLPQKICTLYANNYHITIRPNYIMRVILDDAAGGKWDEKFERPAYKNMTTHEIRMAVYALKNLTNPKILAQKIEESNKFRDIRNQIPKTIIDHLNKIDDKH